MFIRRKKTGNQEYFYLCYSERKGSKVRQRSFYIGKTLGVSEFTWSEITKDLEQTGFYNPARYAGHLKALGDIVRAYLKKHRLPVSNTKGLWEFIERKDQEWSEEVKRFWANQEARKNAGGQPAIKQASIFQVFAAAELLGISTNATEPEIKAA